MAAKKEVLAENRKLAERISKLRNQIEDLRMQNRRLIWDSRKLNFKNQQLEAAIDDKMRRLTEANEQRYVLSTEIQRREEEKKKIIAAVRKLRELRRKDAEVIELLSNNIGAMKAKIETDDETFKQLTCKVHELDGKVQVYERLIGKLEEVKDEQQAEA